MTKKTEYKTANDEMNVIWKKDKLQKFSKESIMSPTMGSGDGGGAAVGVELHCRLCGATDHLQLITEDHLDQTLRVYFGVQVPPEGVICESCVKCVKITENFSALVYATFNRTIDSEESSRHTKILANTSPGHTDLPANGPHDLYRLDTKLSSKREPKRKIKSNSLAVLKKMNIACSVCGHKYPVILPIDGVKSFVCSRCQQNREQKNNTSSSGKELRCYQTELKGKSRLYSLPKKPQQLKLIASASKHDKQSASKKQPFKSLLTYAKDRDGYMFTCSVCGFKLRSKELLEKHLRDHRLKNFQSFECMRSFRSNRTLLAHFESHKIKNKYFR